MSRTFVRASSQYLGNGSSCPVATYPFTVAGWALPSSTGDRALVSMGQAGVTQRHLLYITASDLRAFSGNGGTSGQSSGISAGNGSWIHCAGVYSANNNRVSYVDGANGVSNSTTVNVSGLDRIYFGAYYNNGLTAGFYYDGLMAEWGVWNVALTAAEIGSLAAGVSPLMVRPDALVAYYPMYARATDEEDWSGIHTLTNTGTTAGTSRPRIRHPFAPQRMRKFAGGGSSRTSDFFHFF